MEDIPTIIFIVPYRDREQQKSFFINHMKTILNADYEENEYKILFIHQTDNRSFNRGAMKNIGFLAIRDMYPESYQDITLVFNDIDTVPYTNILDYETMPGIIKHFYGYKFALGGIVSINAGDFEKINGFPNYWTWGYEDNMLNNRALEGGLTIDRTQFYPIMDKNILQGKDGIHRLVNEKEFTRFLQKTPEGITSIQNLEYDFDLDNLMINVLNFNTEYEENKQFTKMHDLRNGSRPFLPSNFLQNTQPKPVVGKMKMVFYK